MYENYKLCSELREKQVCIVVHKYWEGSFEQLFHTHIPKQRLSQDNRMNTLRSLVVHYSGTSPEMIVGCFINKQGKEPPHYPGFQVHVSYPEPGVLRTYCGTDVQAWCDVVTRGEAFRVADLQNRGR
jgi:hypothetical protein